MTTIKLGFILFLGMTIFACQVSEKNQVHSDQSNSLKNNSYSIDTTKSYIKWKGSMLGLYDHFGTIELTQGTITIEDEMITGGAFSVDMSTINPQDKNYSRERPRDVLTGHLEGEDFFSVLSYPTAEFVISKSKKNIIDGELTIKNIVNKEQVTDVKLIKKNGTLTATGKMVFDRQNYDISFMASNDLVISDDIELEFFITTLK